MKVTIKIAVLAVITLFISSSFVFGQDEMDHSKMKESNKKSCCPSDNTASMESKCGMDKDKMSSSMGKSNNKMMGMDHGKMENSIVREGVIDVEAIDTNKDGKVFQDVMDWNVISDEAGKCPLCGMTLKEVTIDDAKKNLKKNNFEVKS